MMRILNRFRRARLHFARRYLDEAFANRSMRAQIGMSGCLFRAVRIAATALFTRRGGQPFHS